MDKFEKGKQKNLNDVELIVISHDFDWQSVILAKDFNIINISNQVK